MRKRNGTGAGKWCAGVGRWGLALLLSGSALLSQAAAPPLVDAARQGDPAAVRSLLEAGAEANRPQGDGATALHWAVYRNDPGLAGLLLDHRADPNAANDYGVTPLMLACTSRSPLLVEKLLEAGADPNAALWTGETALMTCARTGTLEAVALLLDHGADPNARESRRGQTALMWALAEGHGRVARALVERGAEVRARSSAGFTPLLFAAQQGGLESARRLLESGADVNESTPEFGNALTVASASGHEELSLFLLERGADPNVPDGDGVTPLHHAVQRGLATFNGIKYDGVYRPLPLNRPKLVEALLSHGAHPNPQILKDHPLGPDAPAAGVGLVGQTPLFLAALSGDAGIIRILAENGADPALAARGGVTPLMAAAGAGRYRWTGTINQRLGDPLEAVRTLVELGVDVNAQTAQGQTAMHTAAFMGEDAIVQFLADQGAEVDAEDRSGQTPWTMAQGWSPGAATAGRYGIYESTSRLLLKLGARPRSREEIQPIRFEPGQRR